MLEGSGLRSALQRATQHVLACGALQPIESALHVTEEGGVRFLVRQLSPLGRQRLDRRRARGAGAAPNPFLPFDPNLFVADVSPTHVALLNKFALIPHHMLIVTRRFEAQQALLCDADFEALCARIFKACRSMRSVSPDHCSCAMRRDSQPSQALDPWRARCRLGPAIPLSGLTGEDREACTSRHHCVDWGNCHAEHDS